MEEPEEPEPGPTLDIPLEYVADIIVIIVVVIIAAILLARRRKF